MKLVTFFLLSISLLLTFYLVSIQFKNKNN